MVPPVERQQSAEEVQAEDQTQHEQRRVGNPERQGVGSSGTLVANLLVVGGDADDGFRLEFSLAKLAKDIAWVLPR